MSVIVMLPAQHGGRCFETRAHHRGPVRRDCGHNKVPSMRAQGHRNRMLFATTLPWSGCIAMCSSSRMAPCPDHSSHIAQHLRTADSLDITVSHASSKRTALALCLPRPRAGPGSTVVCAVGLPSASATAAPAAAAVAAPVNEGAGEACAAFIVGDSAGGVRVKYRTGLQHVSK